MRPLDLLLGTGSLALVALAAWRIDAALPPPPAPPPTAAPLAAVQAATAAKPLDAYADALTRPLFSPKRRADPSATAAPQGPLHLMGTLLERNRRLALIRPAEGADTAVVAVGQDIGGLRVREIGPDHVLLDSGGGTVELRLPEPTDSPTRPRR